MGRATAERLRREEALKEKYEASLRGTSKKPAITRKNKILPVEHLISMAKLDRIPSCFFIRNPKNYVPKSSNKERQVREIINYALVKYPVPRFMYYPFMVNDTSYREMEIKWFICAAQGGSLYKQYFKETFNGLITKQDTYNFLTAYTEDLTTMQNILYAHSVSIGGKEFSNKLKAARFYNLASITPFWDSVIRFFYANNDLLTSKEISDLLDFLRTQIDYSLKGRTLASVVRASNEWHIEQIRKKSLGGEWIGIPIDDWLYEEKIKVNNNSYRSTFWYVEQLHTGKALQAEGSKMHHCVGSYAKDCMNGRSAIFHMRNDSENCVTIEVCVSTRTILQVRGKYNRLPNPKENSILRMWERQALRG